MLVVRKNEHLAVTMFDEKLGEKGVFLTDILASVCVFAFSIFLIVYGIKLAQQGAGNNMAGINVPYSFMYSALPVTGVLIMLFSLMNAADMLHRDFSGKEEV